MMCVVPPRPPSSRPLPLADPPPRPRPRQRTVTLFLVFASAFVTDIIGVHPIFGGFLAAFAVPREVALDIVIKVEDLVTTLFLPIYFTRAFPAPPSLLSASGEDLPLTDAPSPAPLSPSPPPFSLRPQDEPRPARQRHHVGLHGPALRRRLCRQVWRLRRRRAAAGLQPARVARDRHAHELQGPGRAHRPQRRCVRRELSFSVLAPRDGR